MIAIIQGVLTAIGFSIFGIPHSILWGTVTVVVALIPGIGTALVLLPGIIYLFAIGETGSGIGLLVWGVLAVGLIDNLLGPFCASLLFALISIYSYLANAEPLAGQT